MTAVPRETVEALLENQRRFLAFLESRVGSRADAEEILQDAYVKSVEKASEIRDGEKSTAWFYRLLKNAVADHYRRKGVESRALHQLALDPLADGGWDDPADGSVLCHCVEPLLDTLKQEYRDILRRVDLGDTPVQEVARAEGIRAQNARVRLHRARRALRRKLVLSCRICAEHGCLDCTCGPGS